MKKKLLTVLLGLGLVALLAACGGNAGNSEEEKNSQVGGSQQEENNQSGNQETNKEEGYVFLYQGVEYVVNAEIEGVTETLGEPVSYYEAASCAFEGLDKIYTYSSFVLYTYPDNGVDRLASIYFMDDLVETKEGITLYMSQDDMLAAYGEPTSVNDNVYVYEKGNGNLTFILKDGEIISIEYQTKVDYN